MARLYAFVIACTLLTAAHSHAAEPIKFESGQLLDGNISNAQRPKYPYEARRRRLTGRGIFTLNIDRKTGEVVSIKIEKSTGHPILDVSCLQALIQWRFQPGMVSKVRLPIAFTMTGGYSFPAATPNPVPRPSHPVRVLH